MTNTKWQNLFSQLEITGKVKSRDHTSDIQEFETQTGIILPADYKTFWGVFGEGRFNEFVTIINLSDLKFLRDLDIEGIAKFQRHAEFIAEFDFVISDLDKRIKKFNQFINSALRFADGPANYDIYWDLTTYSEQDKSYEICRAIAILPFSYQQLLKDMYGYQSFVFNLWGLNNKVDTQVDYELLNSFDNYDTEIPNIEESARNIIHSALEQLPSATQSYFSEFNTYEEEVWWRNITSGAAYKLAHYYAACHQFEDAVIVYLQIAKITQETELYFNENPQQIKIIMAKKCREISGFALKFKTNILHLDPIARLRDIIGDTQFQLIYQAVMGKSISSLFKDSYVSEYTDYPSFAEASKYFENWQVVEQTENYFAQILNPLPFPDDEFQKQWLINLQSIREQIAIGSPVPDFFDSQYENEEQKPLYYFEYLERLDLPSNPLNSFFDSTVSITYQELIDLQRYDSYYGTFRYLKTLKGHSRSVYSIAISPDGQLIASGSADTTIKIWNLQTHQEIKTLRGHTNSVLSFANAGRSV